MVEEWWAINGGNVTAEFEAAVSDLEALGMEIESATASKKAEAEANGELLHAELEAFAAKVEQTLEANKHGLENAVEDAIDEAEVLADKVETATVDNVNKIEDLASKIESLGHQADEAAEDVLESHRPEIEAAAAELEAGLTEAGAWLKAELEELAEDLDSVDGVELFANNLYTEVIPRKKMGLVETIAYSTGLVFLVAAFAAAALYTPKDKKVEELTEVVVDVEAKPTKKAIKKTLKSIMKNNNTKTSLIQ